MSELSFIHRFEPGDANRPPLLLLHGTGGDENDLVALGMTVAPGSALLSPRGKVLEDGMPRFFRRLAEGVFDEDDVDSAPMSLPISSTEARKAYGLPRRSRSASRMARTSPRLFCVAGRRLCRRGAAARDGAAVQTRPPPISPASRC